MGELAALTCVFVCMYVRSFFLTSWVPKYEVKLFSLCATGPGSQASEGVQRFIGTLQSSLVHDMANKLGLRVPMKINVKMGARWGELQPVH